MGSWSTLFQLFLEVFPTQTYVLVRRIHPNAKHELIAALGKPRRRAAKIALATRQLLRPRAFNIWDTLNHHLACNSYNV
jgi:hypothetical protein